MAGDQRDWYVLLIGGPSGAGKSVVAEQLGLRLGTSWLGVDDLRLALQLSRARLPDPADTEALYFFADIEERRQDVWSLPPERLRDALIATGEAMSLAIEAVIENHVDQRIPIIVEGDGVLPSIISRPAVASRLSEGNVRAVFLVEPDMDALYANMVRRGRGIVLNAEAEVRTEARAKWLFGQWIAAEAEKLGISVVESRPWETLVGRVMEAAGDS